MVGCFAYPSGEASYRDFLKGRLKALKQNNEDLARRAAKPKLVDELGQFLYHANWLYSACHILSDVPKYRSMQALAERLQVKQETLELVIEGLVELGYIRKIGKNKFEYAGGSSHTPKDSPLVILLHQNWRNRAILDAQNPAAGGLHYTGIQAISVADFKKIKSQLR